MYVFLSILIALIAVILVFVVTIQNSKGGGLAAGFASSNQFMGVRKTTDLLEKVTWGLAAAMIVLCVIAVRWAPKTEQHHAPESVISDYVDQATIPVPAEAQPFGDASEDQAAPATEAPVEENNKSAE